MALQVLTQNEIDAVSGGCHGSCGKEPPIEIEAPGLCVGLDPLLLVNSVLGLVGGVVGGVTKNLLGCIL